MYLAVEIFEILAAMSDHRPRERGHRFRRNFDWAGSEKLIVRNHEAIIRRFRRFSQIFLLFEEADVAAAFDVAFTDVLQVFRFRAQTHVFFDVVFGDVIAMHGLKDEIAVIDDQFRSAFDENAKRVRVKRDQSEQSMNQN